MDLWIVVEDWVRGLEEENLEGGGGWGRGM